MKQKAELTKQNANHNTKKLLKQKELAAMDQVNSELNSQFKQMEAHRQTLASQQAEMKARD